MQLAVDVSEPKIIGISGPTKAGKTTLASGIARKICGSDRKLPPQFGRDRVERFLGGRGSCISVVGQDSYFKGGERNWELPEAIDHSWVLQTLRDERSDRLSDLIIFEGFKAYWDEEVVRELDLILWIRVNEETSKKRRMRNKSVTHEVWNDMWHHHGNYEKHWVKLLGRHVIGDHEAGSAAPEDEEKCVTLDGEQPAETVLKQALDVLLKRGMLRVETDETDSTEPPKRTIRTAASRSRSRSRGRQPSASSPLLDAHERCANPSCWFRASPETGNGGYCCRKCHWRHATGFKSGKAHNKECAKIEASSTAPLAAAVAPAEDYVSQEAAAARIIDATAADVTSSQQAIPTEDHTSAATGVSVPVADSMTSISIHFQRKLCCANPNCPFLASSDPLQGGYCCSKCYWRALAPRGSKGAKRHNAGCAKAYPETPGTARAPPDPPEEAKLYGPLPAGDQSIGIADTATANSAGIAGPSVDDALASERSAGQLVEMVARGRIKDRDVVTTQQRRHVGLYESALKAFFSGKYSECIASAEMLLDEKDDVPAKRLVEAAGRLKAQGTDPRRPNLTAL
ncbi:UCK2 [Symbiodinium sp. CCMP2592]|nr:UCK2 [Symbiodinium sp. CCMP2592]